MAERAGGALFGLEVCNDGAHDAAVEVVLYGARQPFPEAPRERARVAAVAPAGGCEVLTVTHDMLALDDHSQGQFDLGAIGAMELVRRGPAHGCEVSVRAAARCCEPGQALSAILECCDDTPEVCDGRDNDCDGVVDNGVLNACGACGEAPQEVCGGGDEDCDGIVDEGARRVRWIEDSPGQCNRYMGRRDELGRCMDDNRGRCSRDELHAWCHRRIDDSWDEFLVRELYRNCPSCVAHNPPGPPWPDRRYWATCVEFDNTVCEDSVCKILTPLILNFGDTGAPPTYLTDTGRGPFDLSRHQTGRSPVLWVADPWLVRLPKAGEPLTARHMFGEATLDGEGKPSFADGFAALQANTDANGDGWITGAELDGLGTWSDVDADRVPRASELRSLTALGVVAIRAIPRSTDLEHEAPKGLAYVMGSAEFWYVGGDRLVEGRVQDVSLR